MQSARLIRVAVLLVFLIGPFSLLGLGHQIDHALEYLTADSCKACDHHHDGSDSQSNAECKGSCPLCDLLKTAGLDTPDVGSTSAHALLVGSVLHSYIDPSSSFDLGTIRARAPPLSS